MKDNLRPTIDLNESYTEILKLDKMLTEANIPHTLHRFLDGYQVIYEVAGKEIADAIEHMGSYGHDENLLEIMGLLTPEEEKDDSVLGYLTAEEVFNRMSEHYKSRNEYSRKIAAVVEGADDEQR